MKAEVDPEVTNEVVDELIDAVISSNNRQPSVPGVVLDAIKDVIDTEPMVLPGSEEKGKGKAKSSEEETQEVNLDMDDEYEEKEKEKTETTKVLPKESTTVVVNGHISTGQKAVEQTRKEQNGDAQKGIFERSKEKRPGELERRPTAEKAVLRKKDDETGESTISRQVCCHWFSLILLSFVIILRLALYFN